MNLFKRLLLLAWALSTPTLLSAAHASETSFHSPLSLGIGALQYSGLKTARNARGDLDTYGTFYPALALTSTYEDFQLNLAYTVFGKKTADDAATTKIFNVTATYAFYGDDTRRFRAGTGVLFYSIHGKGGSVSLQNGTTTSTFYRPSDSSTSRIFHWDAGADFSIMPMMHVGTDFILVGPLSSKRTLSFFLSLNYAIL